MSEEETKAAEEQEEKKEESRSEERASEKGLDDKDKEIARLTAINKEVIESRDKAKTKLRNIEAEADKSRQAELEEQGKYQALYEEEKAKRETTESRLRDVAVSSALAAALEEANASSVDTALALVDKDLVKISKAGEVIAESVADAIAQVKEQHNVLFTGPRKGPTNARAGEEEPTGGYEDELKKIIASKGSAGRDALAKLREKYGKS